MDILERSESIITSFPAERRFALAVMQDLQREFGYVPRESLLALSQRVGCFESELYAMATFYKALSLKPKGRHIVKVCDGTACHIKGSTNLTLALERELGIKPGETTPDGEFSIELVNCLGSCALAPVMVIDEAYFGKVTLEKLPGILETYTRGGEFDE